MLFLAGGIHLFFRDPSDMSVCIAREVEGTGVPLVDEAMEELEAMDDVAERPRLAGARPNGMRFEFGADEGLICL